MWNFLGFCALNCHRPNFVLAHVVSNFQPVTWIWLCTTTCDKAILRHNNNDQKDYLYFRKPM